MTVEVDTNSMAIALQLKDDLNIFLREKIYPLLDTIFTESIANNKIASLDKLEINLNLNEDEKLTDLIPQIISKTKKEIALYKEQNSIEINRKFESKKQIKSIEKSRQKALIFYLQKGQYPWWFNENNKFSQEDFKDIKINILKQLINSSISLNRILYQFDIKLITAIFLKTHKNANISSKQLGKIPTLLQNERFKVDFFRLIFQHDSSPHSIQFMDSLFKLILIAFQSKYFAQNEQLFLQKKELDQVINLLQFCTKTLTIPLQLIASKHGQNTYSLSLNKSLNQAVNSNEEIIKLMDEKKDEFIIKKTRSKSSFLDTNSLIKIEAKETQNQKDFDLNFNLEFDEKEDKEIADGILINNAGLVLIHPFIKSFFEKLGFLSDRNIKKEKLDEAVHVLRYLACKEEQSPEHLLLFEKYLCNIPLHYPIKRFIKLTKSQKEACEELLQAMLSHWERLKTQNTDALRSEFLMREGKLTTNNERDSLYIQRKTQDILLDSIPWNFHVIKIPWKKKIVFVEW